ncbi:hypothetical protein DV735_g1904, partial [Chaetothyriales sp. CBS 134920]
MTPSNLYKTPTALPAIGDGPPSLSTVSKTLGVRLLAADNTSTTLGQVLASTERRKVLVILIRHFYCTNCQEYIRQMSKSLRRDSLASRDTSVIIIGCGEPTLIAWYVKLTQSAYPIYVDPNTRLYKLLGTHRTVSRGTRRPSYVQHSLFMESVMSLVQGIKRLAVGDVRRAGNLRVNGGEFLFWRDGGSGGSGGAKVNQQQPQPQYADWKIWWCHRMRNTRDHTEIDELRETMGLSSGGDSHYAIKHNGNGTTHYTAGGMLSAGRLQALRQSNQSWMSMLSSTNRKRKQQTDNSDNSLSEKTKVQQNRQPNGLQQNGLTGALFYHLKNIQLTSGALFYHQLKNIQLHPPAMFSS